MIFQNRPYFKKKPCILWYRVINCLIMIKNILSINTRTFSIFRKIIFFMPKIIINIVLYKVAGTIWECIRCFVPSVLTQLIAYPQIMTSFPINFLPALCTSIVFLFYIILCNNFVFSFVLFSFFYFSTDVGICSSYLRKVYIANILCRTVL